MYRRQDKKYLFDDEDSKIVMYTDDVDQDESLGTNRNSFTLTEIQHNIPSWRKNSAILFYQNLIESSTHGLYLYNAKAKLFRNKPNYKIHTRDLYIQYLAWLENNKQAKLEKLSIENFENDLNLFHKAFGFETSKPIKISGITSSGFEFEDSSTNIKSHIIDTSDDAWFLSGFVAFG